MESESLSSKASTTKEAKSKTFFKATIAGVVTAGLVAAWLIVYLKPILSAKYEEQELKNNIQVLKISRERNELDNANNELKLNQIDLSKAINALEERYNELQVQYAALENKQKKFNQQYKDSIEKARNASSENNDCLTEKEELTATIAKMEENYSRYQEQAMDTERARTEAEISAKAIQETLVDATIECEVTLPVSWVKPKDWIGRHYSLKIDKGLYVWPMELNDASDNAKIIINTSNDNRSSGNILINNEFMQVGTEKSFWSNGSFYKLKLLSIRQAGKLPTDAAYFTAKKCTNEL